MVHRHPFRAYTSMRASPFSTLAIASHLIQSSPVLPRPRRLTWPAQPSRPVWACRAWSTCLGTDG